MAGKGSTVRFDVERFTGKNNFTLWRRRMKDLLIQQGLSKVLLGKSKKPETITDDDWADMEERACSAIRLNLSDEALQYVSEIESATEVWLKLESIYMTKSLTNKLFLKKRLYSLQMSEGGDLLEHLNVFNQMISELTSLDVKFEDEDIALLLLASLPDSFDHLVTTLLYGKETLEMEEVTAALISNNTRKKASSSKCSGEGLFAKEKNYQTRGRSIDRRSSSRGRSKSKGKFNGRCYGCNQEGHTKRFCPNKYDKRKKSSDEASIADSIETNDVDVLSISSGKDTFEDSWIMDSGCTFHMCPHREAFDEYKAYDGSSVLMGNDSSCKTVGFGTVKIKMFDGVIRTLADVRHVPGLRKNLISLGALESNGCKYTAQGGVLKVIKGALVVLKGLRHGNLYRLIGTTVQDGASVSIDASTEIDNTNLWHMRLGHMGERGLMELHKRNALQGIKTCKLNFCKFCVFGKQCRTRFNVATHTSKGVLEYVHTDVWGPSPVKSKGGKEFFVTFIDDFSRKVWVYFMRHKSEVFEKFKEWKAEVETSIGKKVKCLRSDNGGEYKSTPFIDFCKNEGIKRHFTVPDTPQQNGVAERMNRTLLERARSMRLHAGLSKEFWAEAVCMACYLVNRSPSTAIKCKIPEEVWTGKVVNYSYLRIFGCPAFVHVQSSKRSKLDPKSKQCIFLGYEKGVKGYKLWDPSEKKVLMSRDVIFNESAMLKSSCVPCVATEEESDKSIVKVELETTKSADIGKASNEASEAKETVEVSRTIATGRGRRTLKAPERYGFEDMVAYALTVGYGDPSSYHEALKSDHKEKWMTAMMEEMESLQRNETWELVKKPKDHNVIGCKWVLRRKEASTEKDQERYKARLVAKGYAQKEGIDYDEIFSPVVKHTSIRVLLAMVAMYDLELEQLDVKTAFLHGDLEEKIFMEQPEGFKVEGKEDHVCLLKRSLYGLKQSPRQWNKRFDSFMLRIGYMRSVHDSCVYYKVLDDKSLILLMLYVDDMLVAARKMRDIISLKSQLSIEFDMKDLGAAKRILGMEIFRDRHAGKLWVNQKKYVEKVLKRFNMGEAKPVSTPLSNQFKLSEKQCPVSHEEAVKMSQVPYANAIGSLMYAMVCSRPDLAHAVSVVSRYMSNPGKEHWEAVKWIFRYLTRTAGMGLMFSSKERSINLAGYVDSDFAGDLDKRRSITGYVFTLGGGAISWKAMLQTTIALSTTEAEYMAATEAAKEGIWLTGLITELGIKQESATLYCDSQSAICLANNQVFHSRTKHIEVRYHKIRELVENGSIDLKKIHTKDNPADMLTKTVTMEKFKSCRDLISLTHH